MKTLLVSLAVALLTTAAVCQEPFVDPRSHEVVRLDCVTGTVRSELTLFGNGTLRLREGEIGAESMALSELDPDGYEAYMRRLRAESLDDGLKPPPRVDGLWTEECVLRLDVIDGPVGSIGFGAFDSKSLALSRMVGIVRELQTLARVKNQVAGLSRSYVPRLGDVLLHRDGTRYRVDSLTSDGTGLELSGIEQPLTIYVAIETLPEIFVAVEE